MINAQNIRTQIDFLKRARDRMERLGARKAAPEATENVAHSLAALFKGSAARQKHYTQRLRYGLLHYYVRHYHPSSRTSEESM